MLALHLAMERYYSDDIDTQSPIRGLGAEIGAASQHLHVENAGKTPERVVMKRTAEGIWTETCQHRCLCGSGDGVFAFSIKAHGDASPVFRLVYHAFDEVCCL